MMLERHKRIYLQQILYHFKNLIIVKFNQQEYRVKTIHEYIRLNWNNPLRIKPLVPPISRLYQRARHNFLNQTVAVSVFNKSI